MALVDLFEDLEDYDKDLLKTFNIITEVVTQKIDTFFKKLEQCLIRGDISLINDDILPYTPVTLSETVLMDSNNIKKRTSNNIKKRTALANITDNVNNNNVTIKQEKLSLSSQNMISNKDNDKMPPPTIFPIKKEECHTIKRSTRTTRKPKRYADETFLGNSSDVIIQNETIPIIDITENNMPTRSTRTRTIRKCTKRKEELPTNSEPEEVKEELKKQENSKEIESSICTKSNEANATYVLIPQLDTLSANLTVVIEKSKVVEDSNSKLELNKNMNGYNQDTFQKKICTSQVNEKKPENKIKKALQKKAMPNKTTEMEKEMMQMEKKKALLQAKSEETRRRRELKHLKAQQLRQNLEEEKKLENQKSKKPKYNQTTAVKLRKQMEGPMQKMDDKVNKQADNVGNVVSSANHDLCEPDKKKTRPCHPNLVKLPVYMAGQMPLLPTDDCYDSDESKSAATKQRTPEWSTAEALRKKQLVMAYIGHPMMNTLFCCTAQTPDLEEIFECINPTKLIRTSSAVWSTPPRYTFLSLTEDLK